MSLSDEEKTERDDQGIEPINQHEDPSLFPAPKAKMHAMLEQFEYFLLQQKGGGEGIDISEFTDSQRDKLLEIISQNEGNAFKYHTKRIEAAERIELKRIGASTIDRRTRRYIAIFIPSIFLIITLCILFFKDDYFDTWLAFLIGLIGGAGGMKLFERKLQGENFKSLLDEEVTDSEK